MFEGYPTSDSELQALPKARTSSEFCPIVAAGQVVRSDNDDGSFTVTIWEDGHWAKRVIGAEGKT